jgi:hypothetical protein
LGIKIVPTCTAGSLDPSSGGGGTGVGTGAVTVVGGAVDVVVLVELVVLVDVVVLVEVVVASEVAGNVVAAPSPPLLHAPRTSAPATVTRAQRRMVASLPVPGDHGRAAMWVATSAAVRRACSMHAGTPMPS